MKTGKGAKTRTKNDIPHLPGCFSRRQNAKPTSTPLISQPECPSDATRVRAQPSCS